MREMKSLPVVTGGAGAERPERLGIVGTLVLHSQFILIAGLVLTALVLKLLAR